MVSFDWVGGRINAQLSHLLCLFFIRWWGENVAHLWTRKNRCLQLPVSTSLECGFIIGSVTWRVSHHTGTQLEPAEMHTAGVRIPNLDVDRFYRAPPKRIPEADRVLWFREKEILKLKVQLTHVDPEPQMTSLFWSEKIWRSVQSQPVNESLPICQTREILTPSPHNAKGFSKSHTDRPSGL